MHADNAVVLEQDVIRGRFRNSPTRETDDQIAAVPADHATGLIEDVAADRVVHDVHAVVVGGFADRFDQIFSVVIDHHFGTELLADLNLLRAAGRGEDPRARRQTQLYGRRSDATGAGVDEERLARLDLGAIVQRVVRRRVVREYGGRFGGRDRGGQRERFVGAQHRLFGQASRYVPGDPVAQRCR
jgi:hypothetical protein